MINFKNIAENLGIVIMTALVTSYITYKATISSALEVNKQSIEGLRPALVEAIKKETTAIKNDISVQVDKIKKSDSLNINIRQIPENKLNQTLKSEGSIPKGYALIKIENLTNRQRKRLNL